MSASFSFPVWMILMRSRYIFDLKAAIPYHSMPEAEREEIWDDGLHFTPKGYERMGKLVAARLFEIIDAKITAEVLAES